ncbi:MAG: hypothetical protein A2163_03805 [Actinobacteria bacterium RBG_13_35_12]|nr:MAG: hypothetical protein A2163_03805 [Actinobacteria bacterium RBG_13_35_12]
MKAAISGSRDLEEYSSGKHIFYIIHAPERDDHKGAELDNQHRFGAEFAGEVHYPGVTYFLANLKSKGQ